MRTLELVRTAALLALGAAVGCAPSSASATPERSGASAAVVKESHRGAPLFADAHVHITNYVQEGLDIRELLAVMGTRVHRATLFGIPLQQQWSHRVSGGDAPDYYLETDAPLYYYSFTDAAIATEYLSLPPADRARFDPMITGFNPADMYGADHVRRVLLTFPGVFSGVGEFTIHKEFVSSKIAGDVPSLTDPALDRILDLAGEVGLVVLLHNDVDTPFPADGTPRAHLEPLVALFRRHPDATIIWAHTGLGRVVGPVHDHVAMLEDMLDDPSLRHVCLDLSWSELAKYVVATPDTTRRVAALVERHSDRFLFGTDTVAPASTEAYLEVFHQYAPLWEALSPEANERVRIGNYERVFDRARTRVRAWERAHSGEAPTNRARLEASR